MQNLVLTLVGAIMMTCFGLTSGIPCARAADLTVTPAVIDAHGLPLDMMHYDLTLTNTSGRQMNVFAAVNDLTAGGQQVFTDPSIANRPASLADWMEVSRGAMMLAPGETRTVPLDIAINPYAVSGVYHAVVSFAEGSTRDDAEQRLAGAPQTIVTVTVASNAKELLQIDGFGTARNFYSGFPVSFSYTLRNAGNVPSTPSGSILLYDRAGHELGSIAANPSSTAIAPGAKQSFTASWGAGPSLGQYKAVLAVSYGAADVRLESIALFWILPWQRLLAVFLILMVAVVAAAALVHRSYERRHRARRRVIENLINEREHYKKHGVHAVVDLRHPRHDHE